MAVYMTIENTAKFKIEILARDRSGVKCLLEEHVAQQQIAIYEREEHFLSSSFFFLIFHEYWDHFYLSA